MSMTMDEVLRITELNSNKNNDQKNNNKNCVKTES